MDLNPDINSDPALAVLAHPSLDLPFLRPARLDAPSAWWGHVPFAHWLVAAARPQTIVELGAYAGVSYSAFCEAVVVTGSSARCVAVDTWEGDEHSRFYTNEVYENLRQFHDPRYASFSELMRCTFDDARPFFPDGSVDLLHIDGLHTYDAARHDWETWRTALSSRAVVLFHDINEHQGTFGVWRLWDELREASPSFTFLHAHGLGVLAPGGSPPETIAQLCSLSHDPPGTRRIRDRFAQLGARWEAHAAAADALRWAHDSNARIPPLEAERTAIARDLELAHAAAAVMQDQIQRLQAGVEAAAALQHQLDILQAGNDAARLHEDAAQSRQAAALSAIAALEATNAQLEDSLRQSRLEQDRSTAAIAELSQALARQDSALAASQASVQAILRSKSWRATAPLRALLRTLRRH